MFDQKRVIQSMGGGMESTSTLKLTLQDPRFTAFRPDLVLMADLGDEWPETYAHMEWLKALCAREGIEFHVLVPEVRRGKKRFGENRTYRTLYDYQWDMEAVPGKAPGGMRLCTDLFKVKPITTYLKERYPGEELVILIGFGADEKGRIVRGENEVPGWTNRFLLDEAGMCRCMSIEYMRAGGWPVPRRSGCTFCPFAKKLDFQVQAEAYPKIFAETAALERNGRRFLDPEKPIYLNAGTKSVEDWIRTADVKRRRVCKGCGKEIDLALHTFGDTWLYGKYKEIMAKKGA
jgi:hypothetical protein